jgi:hypothetical protein
MNDAIPEEDEAAFFICEIHDEVLEAAARAWNKRADPFTQSMCTALYLCPGP